MAVEGAPFSMMNEKEMENSLSLLDIAEAEELLEAIIRESMRYKKKVRDIRLEFLKTNPQYFCLIKIWREMIGHKVNNHLHQKLQENGIRMLVQILRCLLNGIGERNKNWELGKKLSVRSTRTKTEQMPHEPLDFEDSPET